MQGLQEDPLLGARAPSPPPDNWVQTAHTDRVKRRTLELYKLHLNLRKQCLIIDQKHEMWHGGPPGILPPRHLTAYQPAEAHNHIWNNIVLFKLSSLWLNPAVQLDWWDLKVWNLADPSCQAPTQSIFSPIDLSIPNPISVLLAVTKPELLQAAQQQP